MEQREREFGKPVVEQDVVARSFADYSKVGKTRQDPVRPGEQRPGNDVDTRNPHFVLGYN